VVSAPQESPNPERYSSVTESVIASTSVAALVEMLRVFAQQEETLLIGGPTEAPIELPK
jgi:hypothetical protein